MNHIIRFLVLIKIQTSEMWKWFHGFKLLSFSHTRLREIVIIIIHNTIKTIWPIFKKLTQCVETNLVWHRRRDDWIFGVKSRRSQGAVYREDIHSIFFFFWIVMIDGSDFQVPWVTPLARLFWIKVFKKILNAPSQWLLFLLLANYTCRGSNSHKLLIFS